MSLTMDVLPAHHKHCDDIFVAAENAAQSGDWAQAEKMCHRFAAEIEAHMEAEEGTLFPAFEAATGMTGGPTAMMRMEHRQMRDLIEQLKSACTARNQEDYAGVAETLLMLMQQHNMKEENILYPMCDRALGAEAAKLADEIGARLASVGAAHA